MSEEMHPVRNGFAGYADATAIADLPFFFELIGEETGLRDNQTHYDAALLYCCIKGIRPDLWLEIGRGNGGSTLIASKAMSENRKGRIVSFDLYELTAHDLLNRAARTVPGGIRQVIGDVREPGIFEPEEIVSGCEKVAVLVDAHEGTGEIVVQKLFPLLQSKPMVDWYLFFHDVLYVPEKGHFDSFSDSYQKTYPFASPYEEYAPIFRMLPSHLIGHFAQANAEVCSMIAGVGIDQHLSWYHYDKQSFQPGIDKRRNYEMYQPLRNSVMMCGHAAGGRFQSWPA